MHIIIIGNGISGVTAARHIRKRSSYKITIISAESPYFFSRTALMYIYMGHMRFDHTKPYADDFWQKNDIALLHDTVTDIHPSQKAITLQSGEQMHYDKLIIACGSSPKMPGIEGENLPGVQGFYSLQDLEKMELATKNIKYAVVIGAGLIGVELAEMLHSRNISVTLLNRGKYYWDSVLPEAEGKMINNHLQGHYVHLHHEQTIQKIDLDDDGKKMVHTADLNFGGDFIAFGIGVKPNITWLKNTSIELDAGILVNEYCETNLPDIYAIGDCAQFKSSPGMHRKHIEQVWYTGRMQGEALARTITGKRTAYAPGPWFNSAKFFDIEYQTYGHVPAQEDEDLKSIIWKDEAKEKLIRIVYHHKTLAVVGFNLLGIRFRHEVCDQWLRSNAKLKTVMQNLDKAVFQPEFEQDIVVEVIHQYKQTFPDEKIQIRSSGWLQKLFKNA